MGLIETPSSIESFVATRGRSDTLRSRMAASVITPSH
jgi:hypothetical protein